MFNILHRKNQGENNYNQGQNNLIKQDIHKKSIKDCSSLVKFMLHYSHGLHKAPA